MFRTVLLALAALSLASGVGGQVSAGEGVTLDFTGRAQVQFSTTSLDGDELPPGVDVPATAFETRRIRLGADLAVSDWLTAKVEGDFAGAGARLTDGWVDLALDDALAITAGQFKKPFGLFELTSSTQTITIERAVRLRGLTPYLASLPGEPQTLLNAGQYLGRDIGVMAHGVLGPVAYAAGVFNGEGSNSAEVSDSKALAARLGVDVGGVAVAGSVSRQPMAPGAGGEVAGTAWELDAEYGGFRVPGLRLMAEVMTGDAPPTPAAEVPTMLGAQAAASWFVPRRGRVDGLEPLLRVSWGDPDRDATDDEGLLVTPGLNAYFTGRNRVMLNADVYVPSQPGLETQYGLRAQLQFHF